MEGLHELHEIRVDGVKRKEMDEKCGMSSVHQEGASMTFQLTIVPFSLKRHLSMLRLKLEKR